MQQPQRPREITFEPLKLRCEDEMSALQSHLDGFVSNALCWGPEAKLRKLCHSPNTNIPTCIQCLFSEIDLIIDISSQ